jgi:cysteine synthase
MTHQSTASRRDWAAHAVRRIEADFQRSSDTHLIPVPLAGFEEIDLYFKDESSHPTGSLKHRLARSLFLYALCNGWLHAGSTVVEASSGSTAISEAYFARLLGLPFVAVMPHTVSSEKIAAIEFYGGRCHLVADPTAIYSESQRLASELGGHYMDQFTYAERATDWRANNNIAESIFTQMKLERHSVPTWLVASAGTGGTLATLGRYVRYHAAPAPAGTHSAAQAGANIPAQAGANSSAQAVTQVCGVDAERSVFYDYYQTRDTSLTMPQGSRIEGIGRPRVEKSFLPDAIDAMVKVPDVWSLGAMHALSDVLGRAVGGSSGTNLVAALTVAQHMRLQGQTGSIVTILCDSGARYRNTYFNEAWLSDCGLACNAQRDAVRSWMGSGVRPDGLGTLMVK